MYHINMATTSGLCSLFRYYTAEGRHKEFAILIDYIIFIACVPNGIGLHSKSVKQKISVIRMYNTGN
jgi:hypothetical protein